MAPTICSIFSYLPGGIVVDFPWERKAKKTPVSTKARIMGSLFISKMYFNAFCIATKFKTKKGPVLVSKGFNECFLMDGDHVKTK